MYHFRQEMASLLQDLVPDYDKGKGEATAEEQHHHPQQLPLVIYRERQVLQKSTTLVKYLCAKNKNNLHESCAYMDLTVSMIIQTGQKQKKKKQQCSEYPLTRVTLGA